MKTFGYEPRGESGISGRRYFAKGKDKRTHHVHIFQIGNENIEKHLIFKHYLLNHPEEAKKYGELKIELANQFPDNTHQYQKGKEAFVNELVEKSLKWKGQKIRIRSSVQAVVINNKKILCVKKYAYNKLMYLLPGGGQEHGETLKEAVIRECFEETGIKVEAKELLYIQEYIGKNHEHANWDNNVHVVAHLFACNIIDGISFSKGTDIDPEQIDIEWLPLEELSNYPFYPKAMIPNLIKYGVFNEKHQMYVGDMG